MNKKSDTKEHILRQASEHNVKFIRLWFCDILGRLKGFAINVEDLEDCIDKGVIFDGGAIEGLARQGESDTIATPDLNTWQILPWRSDENTVARLFCNLNTLNNQEKVIDSREVLQTKLMQANKDDYKFYVSPEVEFYFLDNEKNIVDEDDAGYFDQRSVVNRGSNFRRECVLSLEEMGIPVRSSHHEVSMNQHEIGLRHTDALTMADSIISTRLIVKQTALNHQGFATFMPRPFGNLNGNGLHLYLSLYQGDENIFYSKSTKNNLSKSGESFMAGILEYSAEMSILTNQWINSYKRLLPNLEAPVAGKDLSNRMSDIVRIPHIYQEDKHNARIEFRLPDSACNPYLTFSAILHAGLLGIKNNMKIEKKWKSNIPSSLYEAIKVSENSNFLKDAIGNEAYNSILENKEKEWIEHHSVVTDYERKYYMKFL